MIVHSARTIVTFTRYLQCNVATYSTSSQRTIEIIKHNLFPIHQKYAIFVNFMLRLAKEKQEMNLKIYRIKKCTSELHQRARSHCCSYINLFMNGVFGPEHSIMFCLIIFALGSQCVCGSWLGQVRGRNKLGPCKPGRRTINRP